MLSVSNLTRTKNVFPHALDAFFVPENDKLTAIATVFMHPKINILCGLNNGANENNLRLLSESGNIVPGVI